MSLTVLFNIFYSRLVVGWIYEVWHLSIHGPELKFCLVSLQIFFRYLSCLKVTTECHLLFF